MTRQIFVSTRPEPGEVLEVMTSSVENIGEEVEIIQGKNVVAVGVVTEWTGNYTYQVLVVA